jgi:hypothetical protein
MDPWCRDCLADGTKFNLWRRNGYTYCAACFQRRFGVWPELAYAGPIGQASESSHTSKESAPDLTRSSDVESELT